MSDDITIDVGMNNSQYLAGADQVYGANSKLQASMLGVSSGSMNVQKALHLITPGRATLVGFTALAVAAADTEQNLSGLRATSAVTGISTEKLGKSIRQLARDMPLGNDGSRQLIQQYTQMGVSSAGSEIRIGKLATTVARLAGATGEDPGGLALGMTQFARATGNVNLDPKRYSDLSDSLVHVSKTVGASATDILAFSKNIAPLAQQAGIGATGILGISASFAHLGEDGIGAQTAISKMMGDMSRSVHEGTPEIKNYAEIVGTTADNFKKMYVADPAGTLNKVAVAIAKAGPQGARILETLGLEGVRSQRAIGALVSSGGLQPATAAAQAGYGSGESAKAAEAAFSGVNNSLTELNSASQQLADAFGAPLLAPLKSFIDLLKAPTSLAANAVGSPAGQTALKVIGSGAALFLGMRAIAAPLSLLGIARQMGTSGPAHAAQAGYVANREGMVRGEGADERLTKAQRDAGLTQSRMSRAAERTIREEEAGTLRQGKLGGLRGAAYDTGAEAARRANEFDARRRDARIAKVGPEAYAQEQEDRTTEQTRRAGMSRFDRGKESVRLYGNVAAQTYMGDMNRMRTNATVDYQNRKDGIGAPAYVRSAGEAAKEAYAGHEGNIIGKTMAGQQAFDDSLRASGQHVSMFNQNVKAFGGVAKSYTGLVGRLATDTVKLATRPLQGAGFAGGVGKAATGALGLGRGLLGAMGGGYGLAIMGGIAAYSSYNNSKERNKQAMADYGSEDAYSTINKYREATGKAGVAQLAMNTNTPSSDQQSKSDTITSAKDAVNVTAADIKLAQAKGGKPIQDYSGMTAAQTVAHIKNAAPEGGYNVQDLVALKNDLAIQPGATRKSVQDIMTGLGPQTGVTTAIDAGSNAANIATSTRAARAPQTSSGNGTGGNAFSQWWQKGLGGKEGTLGKALGISIPGYETGGAAADDFRSQGAIEGTKDIGKSIKARYVQQSGMYKGNKASENRIQAQDAAYQAAMNSGDTEQMVALSKDFQHQNMGESYGKGQNMFINAGDVKKYGGFNAAAAALDPNSYGAKGGIYQSTVDEMKAGGGTIKAVKQAGAIADSLRAPVYNGMNNFSANLFDQSNESAAAKAMQASKANPGDIKLSDAAGAAFIKAGQTGEGNIVGGKATPMSLTELKSAADALTNSLNTTSAEAAGAAAAMQQIGLMQSRANIGKSAVAQQEQADTDTRNRIKNFKNLPIPTTEQKTANVADQQALIDSDQGKANKLRTYLEAHRAYEKQIGRTEYEAGKAREYQQADYNTSVSRTRDAAQLQEAHSAFDFNTAQARNEHDFQVTKHNQLRDYNIGVANMELQYNTTRNRALRDFNIQQKRAIEDAAKTMLDPYDRIQTKATWDVQNLMVNMKQQNEAMEKQKSQLDELRKLGVSKQVIDQLQLGKTENAQQVNNLAMDLNKNPNAVKDLNAVGVQRGKDAGALYNDTSNTEHERAKEDLKKNLGDMAVDIKTSLKQSKVAFTNAQNDQEKAFQLSLARTVADYAKNLKWTREATAINLSYMALDNKKASDRAALALAVSLKNMNTDITDADSSILGNLTELHDAAVKTMTGHFGSYKGIMSRDLSDLIDTMNKKAPEAAAALAKFGLTPAEIANTTKAAAAQTTATQAGAQRKGRASGGPIDGFSPHSRADNIEINATAGEFMQPVDAVAHYGTDVMEKIRTKKIPKSALTDYSEPAGYAAGGMVWPSMWEWAHKKFPGTQMTSNYRPGGMSYHAQGSAIDLAPPNAGIFNTILSGFGDKIRELIYSPMKNQQIKDGHAVPDSFYAAVRDAHFNHVHWAMSPGQAISPGMPISGSGIASDGTGGVSAADMKAIFGKFDAKRGGIYGKFRDKLEAAFMAKFNDAGGGTTTGDVGAHGKGAAANQAIAGGLLKRYGFGSNQMSSLIKLWNGESGWNELAANPSSDAYGIPQSLPGSKMSSMGKDWKTNPATQINWGLNYIKDRYGSPDEALKQWNARSPHWYDQGGVMSPGAGSHVNATGKPEAVLTNEQWSGISKLAQRAGELITREESKTMGAAGGTHMTVHHNEVITYDSRNDFGDAKITVMSNDPDDMARQLEKKRTRARITQTRGVRRN